VAYRTDDAEPKGRGAAQIARRLRALSDAALLDVMRGGDELAWGEFADRFRPLLEQFARRTGIPRWEWDACITDVLDEEALKFTRRRLTLPASLGAYLVRAVRNRHLRLKRAAERRERHYASAADAGMVLCSEGTMRLSEGSAGTDSAAASSAMARLVEIFRAELSEDDVLLLTWRGAGVPHRQVAAWLGVSYDAAAKRVARLSQRLRAIASSCVERFPVEERPEVERFLRRVGVPAWASNGRSGGLQ
jgi:DNA-directed RNA polymerase specialized sigma24 family protein